MSFDAFIMPALPQPPAGGESTRPASFKLDRPGQSTDQNRSFRATLNRISQRKAGSQPKSSAGETRTANSARPDTKSANPAKNGTVAHQDPAHDRAAESEAPSSAPESPFRGARPAGLIDDHLFNVTLDDDGALLVETDSDSDSASTISFLNHLMGHLDSEGQKMLKELVGIGPFEQLQTLISPEAHNLYFFKQLAAGAIHHQLAAYPSGPQADAQFLAATPAGEDNPGGRAGVFAARVDALINDLLNGQANTPAAGGLEAATPEASAQKAAVNVAAFNANENLLLNKMIGAFQPAEADRPEMTKLAMAPKDSNSETFLETHLRQGAENSHTPKSQAALKAAEQAVNPNLAAEGVSAKPSEDAISLKNSVLLNEMLSTDQSGSKVMQIDGDAKDSSFLTSQEQLPEHLAKLEHGARSAETAQRSLTSQTMNQIVQKAVLFQNNGQHQVQIDLKPDFLGHIRMQIITESQQVAVRIVAELPFVKDMLESNLSQLKTELQAQGLEVDELEVSVAHDSRADDDQHQKAAEARRARALKNSRSPVDAAAEEQTDGHTGRGDGMAETAIDYFA